MSIELTMPALSPTMEKGTLAKWLVSVGDVVKAGDPLAEIETDKATMEFEAVENGRIESLTMPAGTEDIPVGTVLAVMEQEGEAAPAPRQETATPAPLAVIAANELSVPTVAPPVEVVMSPAKMILSDFINATPLARRIAAAKGVQLDSVVGTGARGRIVKADLSVRAMDNAPAAAPLITGPSAVTLHAPPADVPVERIKLSGMRKTIARRLTESKQTVPHFYLSARCNIDRMLQLRAQINENLSGTNVKLSVNDLMIKAMAIAMVLEPAVNVQFGGDEIYQFDRVDIAMAVALDSGLVTPVIRDVVRLSLSAVAQQSKALAEKARAGKLAPEDYQGGTASVSNLGMYGIDEMFPIINPPQALILGIGSGIEQPWKVDGAIALATILTATASFDHRVIDGAAAARFMAALRDLVENPMQIIC